MFINSFPTFQDEVLGGLNGKILLEYALGYGQLQKAKVHYMYNNGLLLISINIRPQSNSKVYSP